MKKVFFKYILLLSLTITLSCGFKVVDNTINSSFTIKEIKSTGDNRINYKIKNNLSINSLKDSKRLISINFTTKKNKNIKEKNIKNEVVKYEISIISNIKINLIESNNNFDFNISVKGDYTVDNNYSLTLNNEKALIENLSENLSKKILDQINQKINDI